MMSEISNMPEIDPKVWQPVGSSWLAYDGSSLPPLHDEQVCQTLKWVLWPRKRLRSYSVCPSWVPNVWHASLYFDPLTCYSPLLCPFRICLSLLIDYLSTKPELWQENWNSFWMHTGVPWVRHFSPLPERTIEQTKNFWDAECQLWFIHLFIYLLNVKSLSITS